MYLPILHVYDIPTDLCPNGKFQNCNKKKIMGNGYWYYDTVYFKYSQIFYT